MILQAEPQPKSHGLSVGNFRCIANHGFGDAANGYAWSGAWYRGHLYVGTNRHTLAILKKRVLVDTPARMWPVPIPESDDALDLRAHIWRYEPVSGRWDRVFQSPMTDGLENRRVPVAYGFRNMAVFQGKRDDEPAIYTIPACGSYGKGPVLMRSGDGEQFDVISEPGLGLGDPNITTFRGVVPFKGRLFISPSGSRGKCNTAFNSIIVCSDDPGNKPWEFSDVPHFGDPTNLGIFEMGTFNGYLYAGTINVRGGCQLWKTKAEGDPPHHWTKVFDKGADRGAYNQTIVCMAEYKGALYVGTGIQNGGRDQNNNVGPGASEIIRVWPDDTWEVVVGEPRMTRFGFQSPVSGMGPGFNNPFSGYFWRITAHEGSLYVGNFDSSSFLPFADVSHWPEWVQRMLQREGMDRFLQYRGGCELWRTHDGDNWTAITRNGFGNPFNFGIRTLVSTPQGLYVGTANPFGPQVAVEGPGGWRYEENLRGGTEVWRGDQHTVGDAAAAPPMTDGAEHFTWLGDNGAPRLDVTEQHEDALALAAAPLAEGGGPGGDLLDALADEAFAKHTALAKPSAPQPSANGSASGKSDHRLLGMFSGPEFEVRQFFRSAMRNVGYWRHAAVQPDQASHQLLDELWRMLPENCFAGKSVQAIVLADDADTLGSWLQERLPCATAQLWPAREATARLAAAEPADLLLWIEGPSLGTRAANLAAARRALRPGGWLVVSDFVGGPFDLHGRQQSPRLAQTLLVDYFADLNAAGFQESQVHDITRRSWLPFVEQSRRYFLTKLLFHEMDEDRHREVLRALPGGGLAVEAYFVAVAQAGEASA